jgi:hypothetical protein
MDAPGQPKKSILKSPTRPAGPGLPMYLLFDPNFMPIERGLSSSLLEIRRYARPLATWLPVAPAIARVTLQDDGGRSA